MRRTKTPELPDHFGFRVGLAVAVVASFSALATTAHFSGTWKFLRVPPGDASFMDLRTITATANCIATNSEWSMDSLPCSSLGTPYNYPPFIAQILAQFNVTEESTEALGLVLLGLFALGLGVLLYLACMPRASILTPIFVIVSAFSPASFLAVERGNYDTLVFSLLVLAMSLAVGRRLIPAAFVLGIAGGLKLYALGAGLLILHKNFRSKTVVATWAAVTLGGFALVGSDIVAMVERTPQTTTMSFGSSVGFMRLSSEFEAQSLLDIQGLQSGTNVVGRVAGVAVVAAVALIYLIVLRTRAGRGLAIANADLRAKISENQTSQVLLLVGGGAFFGAYFAGANFNYRLIFLVIVVAALVRVGGLFGNLLSGGLIAVQYLYTAAPQSLGPVADILLLVLTAQLVVVVIQAFGVPRSAVSASP